MDQKSTDVRAARSGSGWVRVLAAGAAIGAVAVGLAVIAEGGNAPSPQAANAQTLPESSTPPDNSTPGNDSPFNDASASPVRTITVSAKGTVTVKPDTATIYLGVSVNAPTAAEAMQKAAEKADALIKTLVATGVAQDDIQTTGISLYPQFDTNGKRITGYNASNNVTAKVRQIETAGTVIDAATALVGDEITIGGISFSVENDAAALAEARKAAIVDAKLRADQYAEAAQGSTGKVLSIDESQDSGYQPFPLYAAADTANGSPSTPIQPGTQDIVVNVTVTYELV